VIREGDRLASIIERKAGVTHMAEIERRLEALEKPILTYTRVD
jgi:hypothetical protein